jgi:hypothetical protein
MGILKTRSRCGTALSTGAMLIATLLGDAVASQRAHAAANGEKDALASVRACVAERDDARRLACFDRAAAALPPDARLAAPAPPPAPKMTPEQRFGYQGQIAREEIEKRKAEEESLQELSGRVTRVGAQAAGDFIVTLDNGQVWAQIPTGSPQRLKVGDDVTIKRASLGSFMLSTPNGRGVRVRRVK